MGHARTYLGFDILRRILQDYFGYAVTLIMNITDVDDKIIARAAERNMDHSELSRQWEMAFHDDMRQLRVAPPTVVTRVTEFMPDICDYIQDIVKQDYAYESNGSVYFAVEAFEQNFAYCKLSPEQVHNAALLAEGEGKLTQDYVGDKRSPRDFALWKKTKEGEPFWESPWGPGRPGWHIECSVMASHVLQKVAGTNCMDIHSGGIDLKFPHHDNEMAQAEAQCGCRQWVNYFLHAGHLHIQGLKMSKSLKNFITIQQALELNTARQIRLLFLLHKYNTPMDYGDNTMQHALEVEKRLTEFFHNAKTVCRHLFAGPQMWTDAATQLQTDCMDAQTVVHEALQNDFDTPTVVQTLLDLIKQTNVYMNLTTEPTLPLVVRNVAEYVQRIMGILGIELDGPTVWENRVGTTDSAASREAVLEPILDVLLQFRQQVRDHARNQDMGAVLQACDAFRDELLPPLGVRLEDKAEGSIWKLVDPATLALELEQAQAEAERKAAQKEAAAAEAAKKQALNALTPVEYLQQLTLEDGTKAYAAFGDDGLPTQDATGEPLNKNQLKKVQKLIKTQQTKYDKYMKQQQEQG